MLGRSLLVLIASVSLAGQAPRRLTPDLQVQRKLALVVGNAKYAQSPLTNPPNDVRAVSGELRKLGFTVTELRDATLQALDGATEAFAASLRPGDLAFFYYSGHGLQVKQENYLVPVDFRAASAADVPYKALSASLVRDRLEQSGARLRVMILDACRDNPYRSARSGVGGLASMGSSAQGTLIAFATADGRTAEDNPGESNGLYTKYLLEGLRAPGMTLKQALDHARTQVYVKSGEQQLPFTYDGVIGDLPLVPGSAPAQSAPVVEAPKPSQPEVVKPKPSPPARPAVEEVFETLPLGSAGSTLRVNTAAWVPGERERERIRLSYVSGSLRAVFLLEDVQTPLPTLVERALQPLGGRDAVTSDEVVRFPFGEVRRVRVERGGVVYLGHYYSGEAGSLQVMVYGVGSAMEEQAGEVEKLVGGLRLSSR
jgi:hypothetical protein